jgi:hypothetical protein
MVGVAFIDPNPGTPPGGSGHHGVDFLGRRSAGNLCYASHEEAARRLGLPVQ